MVAQYNKYCRDLDTAPYPHHKAPVQFLYLNRLLCIHPDLYNICSVDRVTPEYICVTTYAPSSAFLIIWYSL